MTSDTRPSTLALDPDLLAIAMAAVFEKPPGWQVLGQTMPLRAVTAFHHAAVAIAAEYSRLLEERVAPESESELRFAAGDR